MARVPRSISVARANFEAAAPGVAARYEAGVRSAEWAKYAASDAAEANYAQRVQAAIAAKSRQKGVQRVGDEVWRSGALEKGAAVISARMAAAAGKYETNFEKPYSAVVRMLASLPPRTIDPMANIDRRLKPVVDTFIKNKLRGR